MNNLDGQRGWPSSCSGAARTNSERLAAGRVHKYSLPGHYEASGIWVGPAPGHRKPLVVRNSGCSSRVGLVQASWLLRPGHELVLIIFQGHECIHMCTLPSDGRKLCSRRAVVVYTFAPFTFCSGFMGELVYLGAQPVLSGGALNVPSLWPQNPTGRQKPWLFLQCHGAS